MIEGIYNIQKEFTELFLKNKVVNPSNLTSEERESWTKTLVLSMMKESTDLLDSFNFRLIGNNEIFGREELLENGVDVFKFLLEILIINGFTIEDIENKFITKSEVVKDKFYQDCFFESLSDYSKIALIDIDGVLSTYPDDFLKIYGGGYDNLDDFKNNDYKRYVESKKKYRDSGIKSQLRVRTYAVEILEALWKKDIKIILLTARPYKIYSRIYHDTLTWLRTNKLKYNSIIWEKDKELYVLNKLKKGKIVLALDDEEENIDKYIKIGLDCAILVDNKCLRGKEYEENSLEGVLEYVEKYL